MNTWCTPHIDAVVQDDSETNAFVVIDFTCGYCLRSLPPNDQHAHAFMTSVGVVQPMGTTKRDLNSAANFQACVRSSFSDLCSNILAWMDAHAIFQTAQEGLLCTFKTFLRLFAEYRLLNSLAKYTFHSRKIR